MGAIEQIYVKNTSGGTANTLYDLYQDAFTSADRGSTNLSQQKYPNRPSRHFRSAWVISCRSWLNRGRYIPLFVNPSDVQWSLPRRGTVQKTAAGTVRNTWRNRFRNTYYDEFTLNITFQSGSIMPSNAYFDKNLTDVNELNNAFNQPQVPPGLNDFYNFLELVDVPKLSGVMENRHVIIMHTRVFPALRLEGFFTEEPITLAESDKDSNLLNWTATFQVYRTYPKISNAGLLVSAYQDFVRTIGGSEAIDTRRLRKSAEDGSPFAAGLDDLGTIPTSKSSRGSATKGAYNNLTVSGSKTLQTKASAARSSSGGLSDEAASLLFGAER